MGKIGNIQEVPVEKLRPYERNAKIHGAEQVEKLKNSINEFGFLTPCLIDEDFNLIAGHGRLMAAKELGFDTVPCVFIDGLTEEQRRAYILADNRLGELGEWDFDLVNIELKELDEMNFDVELTGFELPEIELEPEVEEVEIPEEVETRCKLGDVWKLGGHRLICGDSTDAGVINKLVDGETVDFVYTDPPYGMNAVSKSGVLSEHYKGDILNDDDNTVAIDAFNLMMTMFPDIKQVWWGANYYTECLPSAECWIVWDKNNGASDQTDCELAWSNFRSVVRQFTMTSEKTDRWHPTQKPLKLFGEIIKKFDKEKSYNNVLDVFGGSGSTLLACEQLKKKCFVCELDPYYCDAIIQRWENYTGKKAQLIVE